MKLVHELALKHAGRPVAVLCGGPSLLQHLPAMQHAACFISANQHGQLARPCDYITQADIEHTVTKENMDAKLRVHGVPIVSPLFTADYRLNDWAHPSSSGLLAVALAWLLGGNPILLAGMDCYQGDTYFHTASSGANGFRRSVPHLLDLAASLTPLIAGANVRVMGAGPLCQLWPQYDPAERFEGYEPSPALLARAQAPRLVRMRALQSLHLWKTRLWPYQQATVTETEAAGFVQAGLADLVPL